jgi:hypothetical protein
VSVLVASDGVMGMAVTGGSGWGVVRRAIGVVGTGTAEPPPVVPPLVGGEGIRIGLTVIGAGFGATVGVTIATPTTLPSVAETWARFRGSPSFSSPDELIELLAPVTLHLIVWPVMALPN